MLNPKILHIEQKEIKKIRLINTIEPVKLVFIRTIHKINDKIDGKVAFKVIIKASTILTILLMCKAIIDKTNLSTT